MVTHVQLWVAADAVAAELRVALDDAVVEALRQPPTRPFRLFRDGVRCALSARALLEDADSLALDCGIPPRQPPWWRSRLPELATLASLLFLTTNPSPMATCCVMVLLSLCASAVQQGEGLVAASSVTGAAWASAYAFAAADIAVIPAPLSALGFLAASAVALWRSRVLLLSTFLLCLGALLDRARALETKMRGSTAAGR